MTLFLVFWLALGLASQTSKPRVVPPERHEEISRAMIRVQAAQLTLVRAQREAERAATAYQQLVQKLQKEFDAEGCELTAEKNWICGPPEQKK